AADPHRGGLRAAVGIHRGQHRIVLPVEQPERRIAERDPHGWHGNSEAACQPTQPNARRPLTFGGELLTFDRVDCYLFPPGCRLSLTNHLTGLAARLGKATWP